MIPGASAGRFQISNPCPPGSARMHEALPRNPGSLDYLDLQPIATPSGSRSPQKNFLEPRTANAIGRGMQIDSNVESLDATPLPLRTRPRKHPIPHRGRGRSGEGCSPCEGDGDRRSPLRGFHAKPQGTRRIRGVGPVPPSLSPNKLLNPSICETPRRQSPRQSQSQESKVTGSPTSTPTQPFPAVRDEPPPVQPFRSRPTASRPDRRQVPTQTMSAVG